MNPDDEQLVEILFRNGTITVVGILLSFSLTFVIQWVNNPIPWQLADVPTLVLLTAGIVHQGLALRKLLHHDSLQRRVYDGAHRLFERGVVMTSAGVFSAIVVDFIGLVT